MVGFKTCKLKLRLADFSLDFLNKADNLLVSLVTCHNSVVHIVIRYAVSTCLDHSNSCACWSNCCCHLRNLSLLLCRVDDVLTVNHTYRTTRDRSVPRNIRNWNCNWSTDHGNNFRLTVGINAHYRTNDWNIVSHALVKKRTDRTVDYTACEDSLFRRSALSFEVRTGDFAYCVHLFFIVNRKREEINALSWLFWCCNSNMNCCVTVVNKTRTVCKLCHLACFNL